ncbi:MAG: winged helix-turn-helix domain-containing protein [Phyllobacterium sp.]
MRSSSKGSLQTHVRIDFPDGERLGPGKMQLLELIRSTGSISAAGRAMDMSYRRAWLLVSAMNGMFAHPVVDSQRGGKQGGGAVVTEFGEELLRRYRAMQDKVDAALDFDFEWINANRNR